MTESTPEAPRALVPQIQDDAPIPHPGEVSAVERLVAGILEQPLRDGVHLRAIAAARRVVDEADAMLVEAVRSAIAAGDSWTMVGLALRTSKQNAHRKFAPLIGEVSPAPGSGVDDAALEAAIERVSRELEALAVSSRSGGGDGRAVRRADSSREVVPDRAGGWNVVQPGSDRVFSHHDTQSDAIDRGRQVVRDAGGGELVIHRRDGRIRAKDSIPSRGGSGRSTS